MPSPYETLLFISTDMSVPMHVLGSDKNTPFIYFMLHTFRQFLMIGMVDKVIAHFYNTTGKLVTNVFPPASCDDY
jgi:hypothetical protein